jgi:hypothetical protein
MVAKYGKASPLVIMYHLLCPAIFVIPNRSNPESSGENFDCIFKLENEDYIIDNLLGEDSERGFRDFGLFEYPGFDNYNAEVEEPRARSKR